MIFSNQYHLNFKEAYSLILKLKAPNFLKTELDILYDDFVRWEKSGLLWSHKDFEISAQRRYSYVEYAWVKLVECLRIYGFSYDKIEGYLPFLTQIIDNKLLCETFNILKEDLLEFYDENIIDEFVKNNESINLSEVLNVSVFELLILNAIVYNDLVSVLFFHDVYGFCIPLSGEVYKEMEKDSDNSEIISFLKKSHVSISITQIIKKFVVNDLSEKSKSEKFKSILSTEEHNLLKIIRKKYKDLKSIKIRFESNEMTMLEVKTIKKATAESRLLEHIKKGEYLNIQIESVDGKIVNFENTHKYKL